MSLEGFQPLIQAFNVIKLGEIVEQQGLKQHL
jgi:hypothetical protein